MSDDEVDIDSDDGSAFSGRRNANGERVFHDKRAHHNALERKRRDHIKESFSGLRDAIPTMQGDKSSRAQILKKASEYITHMRKKSSSSQKYLDDLRTQNEHLEAQISALERAKAQGSFHSAQEVLESAGLNYEAMPLPQEPTSEGALAPVYESGSGSSDGMAAAAQQHTTTRIVQQQPQIIQVVQSSGASSMRSIQPGQSLLITTTTSGGAQTNFTSQGEPNKKKIRQ